MSPTLKQIEDNVITDLRIDDTDDDMIDNARELLNALERNTSIESIHFNGFLGCLRGDTRSAIVEVIGNLPNLQEVHITHCLLMAKVLTQMITKSSKLRVLKLNEVVFQGVDEDLSACELALLAHQSLKEFEMGDCSGAAVKSDSLDKLVRAGKKLTMATSEGSPQDINQVGALVA